MIWSVIYHLRLIDQQSVGRNFDDVFSFSFDLNDVKNNSFI